jgi:hypothetical protein
MNIVKEHIDEDFREESDPIKDMGIGRPSRSGVVVDHYFDNVVAHITQTVYPRIHNEEDLYKLNVKLRDWLNKKVTHHKKYRLK